MASMGLYGPLWALWYLCSTTVDTHRRPRICWWPSNIGYDDRIGVVEGVCAGVCRSCNGRRAWWDHSTIMPPNVYDEACRLVMAARMRAPLALCACGWPFSPPQSVGKNWTRWWFEFKERPLKWHYDHDCLYMITIGAAKRTGFIGGFIQFWTVSPQALNILWTRTRTDDELCNAEALPSPRGMQEFFLVHDLNLFV
jgi:hypothetical protein